MNHTEARKRAVYDWVDEHYPWLWDKEGAPGLTDEIVLELMQVARAIPGPRINDPERIRAWVQNPEKHSPFYDEVLVERALDFDLEAWRSLTAADRRELARRLMAMDDPFSEEHPMDWVFQVSQIGTERVGKPFPRRERYLSWPKADSANLRRWFLRQQAQVAA